MVEDINYIRNLEIIKQLLEHKTKDEINKIIKYISDKEEISLIINKSS